MNRLLLFSFLSVSFLIQAQEKVSVRIEKEYRDGEVFPFIEGVYTGEIPINKLGSLYGIQSNSDWKIYSFKLNYSSGSMYKSIWIKSNVIPDTLIADLYKNALFEQIYITEIKAIDPKGIVHVLTPMTLIPIEREEN